jgi:hypothetical protein
MILLSDAYCIGERQEVAEILIGRPSVIFHKIKKMK